MDGQALLITLAAKHSHAPPILVPKLESLKYAVRKAGIQAVVVPIKREGG